MSLEWKQLHFKEQSRIGWNDTANSLFAVCVIRWACELSDLTETHLSNTLIPSFDDFTHSQLEGEGLVSVFWWVEYFAAQQSSCVMDCNFVTFLWEIKAISLLNSFNCEAHLLCDWNIFSNYDY